jgi:hypothetical protein
VLCLRCKHTLGYLPEHAELSALIPAGDGEWEALAPVVKGRRYHMCMNYEQEHVCNWMIPADERGRFCPACRLNKTIPNLNVPGNEDRWARVEAAKRRMVYTLLALRLPVIDRVADPQKGLAFEFLADSPDGERVLTGHADGLITINVAEAETHIREKMRHDMGEKYRTLLGHFRHEIGHYYWDLLIRDSPSLESFRQMFGDERADYAAALQRNYEQGPPNGWEECYISSYASTHPWEDWAETWGNYLHIIDTLETAHDAGLVIDSGSATERLIPVPDLASADAFDDLLEAWFPLTFALNNINRGLGYPDLYPFLLSEPVVAKLRYVHDIIQQHSGGARQEESTACVA